MMMSTRSSMISLTAATTRMKSSGTSVVQRPVGDTSGICWDTRRENNMKKKNNAAVDFLGTWMSQRKATVLQNTQTLCTLSHSVKYTAVFPPEGRGKITVRVDCPLVNRLWTRGGRAAPNIENEHVAFSADTNNLTYGTYTQKHPLEGSWWLKGTALWNLVYHNNHIIDFYSSSIYWCDLHHINWPPWLHHVTDDASTNCRGFHNNTQGGCGLKASPSIFVKSTQKNYPKAHFGWTSGHHPPQSPPPPQSDGIVQDSHSSIHWFF